MTTNGKKVLEFKKTEPSFDDLEMSDLGGSIHDEAVDYPHLSFVEIADRVTPEWRTRSKEFQDAMRWHYDAAHGSSV